MRKALDIFFNTLNNAILHKQYICTVPATNFIYNLVNLLYVYGYISHFYYIADENKFYKKFIILLKYTFISKKSIINNIIKLGINKHKRILKFKHLKKYNNHIGLILLSTHKGIISISLAKKYKIGGILLYYIW